MERSPSFDHEPLQSRRRRPHTPQVTARDVQSRTYRPDPSNESIEHPDMQEGYPSGEEVDMTQVSPANLRAITQLAPDALQPGWLGRTWVGEFGSAGLHMVADEVSGTLRLTPDSLVGKGTMSGTVLEPGGEVVGEVERYVKLHGSGRLEVNHSLLDIDEEFQGTGFARAFNEQAFGRYAEAGVDDVTVTAALDVGGYAWARQGFELLSTHGDEAARELDRATQVRELVQEARSLRSISRREFRELEQRLITKRGTLPPDALTSVQELAVIPDLGRRVLLGQHWNGIRPIASAQSWWSGRVPAGVADAQSGVGWLARPADAVDAASHLEVAARSRLAPALDPARSSVEIAQATGGRVRETNTWIPLREAAETSNEATSKLRLELDDELFDFTVHGDSTGRVSVTSEDAAYFDDELRAILGDAWQRLGATPEFG
jgi:hypothetical protein